MPDAIAVSVQSGRCGPCCSNAPSGTTHTRDCASLISGQDSWARIMLDGRIVPRQSISCTASFLIDSQGYCETAQISHKRASVEQSAVPFGNAAKQVATAASYSGR